MDVARLKKDPEFRALAEEAQNKSRWAYVWTGVTALSALATVGLAVIASPLVAVPSFLGGAAAVGNIGFAAAGFAASTLMAHYTGGGARDDAKNAQSKLRNYAKKHEEHKTDQDLAERLNRVEAKLSAVEHERATGAWAEKIGRSEKPESWREMIARETLDLGPQRQ